MLYTAVKHTHILFAVVSILLFNFRFWRYFRGERPKWARILPHIIDTVFLVTGIILIVQTSLIPFKAGGGWLTLKLGFLVFYILFGIFAMKQARPSMIRMSAYLLANASVLTMVVLAIGKPFIF